MKRIITLVSAIIFGSVGFSQTYVNEDFSSFTMPVQPPLASGWKNIDSLNFAMPSDSIWRFDNPGAHPIVAPMAGNVAIVDSDYYGSGNSQDCYLSTPSFDASLATVVLLEFDHYFQAIGTSFGEIQVFDGINWVSNTVFNTTTGNPTHEIIDISALAAGNSAAQVRFRYSGTYGWQWVLDNVVIFQPTPDDASVVSVDSTVAGCNLTANEQVCATVVNAGSTPIMNFPINYTVNGGTVVSETVNATLNPGDSLVYCFTTGADFSTVGSYDIAVFTSLRNDANNVNDTATGTSVNKTIVTSYPYLEDFENGNGGWISEGANDSWALGTPAGTLINSAASGVNSYVTNLTGDYNNNEVSFVLGPCFDFTNLNAPQFKMNIWWETENSFDGAVLQMSIDNGVTWTKVGDFLDPNNWYNANGINGLQNAGFTGEAWAGDVGNIGSNGWVLAEHDLVGAGNQPSVQLRILFGSDGSVTREGIAFDDILIQEAPAVDGGVVSLVAPGSNCGFGLADSVTVAVANFGSAPLVNFPVTYSFNNGALITDTVRNTINAGDTALFTFTQSTVNLSVPGVYSFTIFTDILSDGNILNDTIVALVENSLKVAPYTENFDLFTPGTGFNNAGSVLLSGWEANPVGSPDFFWGARTGPTGSTGTGPDADNTGLGGNYLYVEGSNGATGSIAELISPCIDLSQLNAARLEFWYHKFGGDMVTLYVDVFDGTVWTNIDSIPGQTQTANADPFLLRQLNLTSFIGNNIQVRFRSGGKTGFGADMAIDDFRVVEPSADDVSMVAITSPESNCGLSTADPVSILVTNVGSASLDTIPVAYETLGSVFIDTIFTTVNPGDTVAFTFSTTVNFSAPGIYDLVAYTELATDGDPSRDTSSVQIENSLRVAPYTENFDLMLTGGTFSNGWVNSSTGAYDWRLNSGQTTSGGTGPSGDNTTGNGNYAYTEASNGGTGQIATLESPCIDASGLSAATLEFYYHMLGAQINTLYIEVGNNNGYVIVDSIVGAQQTAITDPFIKRSIPITSSLGAGNISVRFSSTSLGCCAGDISIDDFRVFEPSLTDAAVIDITAPATGCVLGVDTVKARITNVGLGVLNSIPMKYSLNGGPVVTDTSFVVLNVGDTTEFAFAVPANLSATGTYSLVVYSDLATDGDRNSDTVSTSIDNIPIVSVPYTENFETSNGGWSAYGNNSSWSWGTPAGTYISAAGSGTQAWVTNLIGPYNNNEDSYLESPCMDFSGQTNDPVLTYLQINNTESCCDEGWVELSLDGGVTWTKLIDNGNAVNWYNNTTAQYWNGDNPGGSGIWDITSNVLSGAAGSSDVKVRFAFSSDGSVTEEGFGIDSLSIDIVTSIEDVENQDALAFSVFPNPSIGQFTLIAPSVKGSVNVEIMDTKGQLVYSNIITANDTRTSLIDLSENAKGVYFVKISNEDDSRVEKLIIQ